MPDSPPSGFTPTNYYGSYTDNARHFGANATISGGSFTHTNGDAHYYRDKSDEKSIEQELTNALISCLSFDNHEKEDQKKSYAELKEALGNYFKVESMPHHKHLAGALKRYEASHLDVGQAELRSEIFKGLKEYMDSDNEEEKKKLSENLLALVSRYKDPKNQKAKGEGYDNDKSQRSPPAQS